MEVGSSSLPGTTGEKETIEVIDMLGTRRRRLAAHVAAAEGGSRERSDINRAVLFRASRVAASPSSAVCGGGRARARAASSGVRTRERATYNEHMVIRNEGGLLVYGSGAPPCVVALRLA